MATLQNLVKTSKVLVLSKTSCGYCSMVKSLLLNDLKAKDVVVVELDTRGDGGALQAAAYELTGQRTVPNVFIGGKHIGGNDKTQALHQQGKLVPLLQSVGAL